MKTNGSYSERVLGLTDDEFYSCRQVYQDIKPKNRKAALRAAFLFLGFAFVLTQVTAAINKQKGRKASLLFIRLQQIDNGIDP